MPLVVGDAEVSIKVQVPETKTSVGVGAGESVFHHNFQFINRYLSGTGSNKVDAVWSSRETLSGATNKDLRGSLTSVLDGSTVNFPIVVGMCVINRSTTSGEYVTIGASTTPFITWLAASGDGIRVAPGGCFFLWSPIDGYTTSAGTSDVLTFTPATGTPSVDILIVGRSA